MLRGVNHLLLFLILFSRRPYKVSTYLRSRVGGGYFGVPNPAPPKFEVEGCPNVVTLPNDTRLFSLGEGMGSRMTCSPFAKGEDRSGEYDRK